jgi:hypothetical protein
MDKIAIGLFLLLLLHGKTSGQSILFNDDRDIYEIVDGACTYKKLDLAWTGPRFSFYSLARYKDTIYILTTSNGLYRTTLGHPQTVVFLGNIPILVSSVSFCADKHGMLYGISETDFYRFDPHTSKFQMLGTVPQRPGGDMVFYKDTLMYVSASGVIAVNMSDPPSSQLIIPVPGYWLFGLVSIPVDCNHNKLYGIGGASGQSYPDLPTRPPPAISLIRWMAQQPIRQASLTTLAGVSTQYILPTHPDAVLKTHPLPLHKDYPPSSTLPR